MPIGLDDTPDELASWLRLVLANGIGAQTLRQLLSAFGDPQTLLAAPAEALQTLSPAQFAALHDPALDARIEAHLRWAEADGNHLIPLGNPDYPTRLLQIADPPLLLYVKGNPALLARRAIALVGARSATPQGIDNAQAFARHLAAEGWCIVSGLALGIDAAAHRGALEAAGATVAVVGTGADRIYPARNAELARAIAQQGCILSELPLGSPPLAHHFPRRNRLIAGLAEGVLVVEAARESGSLITARLAAEYDREVFAIPGSIHSPLARGCHQLIREGAKLVECAADILEELRPTATTAAMTAETSASLDGNPAYAKVFAALGHDPADADQLAERSGLTVDALYAILLEMELDGLIARLPGGRFQRR